MSTTDTQSGNTRSGNGASPVGPVRCSDADRERTAGHLQDAVGQGYLTMAEAEERLTRAYAARFRHDLDALTADLPAADPPAEPPGPAGWRAIGTLAAQQLADDARTLLGQGGADPSRRRSILLALATALAVLLALTLVAGMVLTAMHGMVVDHPEFHRFGR